MSKPKLAPPQHSLAAPCWACQAMTGSPQLDLDRRVTWRAPADPTAGTPKTLHIVSSERMLAFCGHACWAASADALAAELDLRSTYPHGPSAPCSRCGAGIDRALPHVRFTLAEMSYDAEQLGYDAEQLGMARCIDDTTWAILCHPACSEVADEGTFNARSGVLRQDAAVV